MFDRKTEDLIAICLHRIVCFIYYNKNEWVWYKMTHKQHKNALVSYFLFIWMDATVDSKIHV